jgi:hypothetical protein
MRIRTGLSLWLLASLIGAGAACAQSAPNNKMLTGGVKNDASLQSSVHLTPESANKAPVANYKGSAGGTVLNTGIDGASASAPLGGGLQQYSGSHLTGATTPITTYTLTPHTSVMQIPGATIITPASSYRGVQNYDGFGGTIQQITPATAGGATAPTYGTQYTTTHGVTTAGGYTAHPILTPGTIPVPPDWEFSFWSSASRTTTNHGVTYAAGLEPKHVEPGEETKLSYGGPATSTTVFGARDGVVSYVPGYEVRVSSTGVQKQTLGGMWSVPEIKTPGALSGEVHPLLAKAQLLPSLLPKADKVTSWELWYNRVSAAIYSKWKYADVGAGTAKVRVTISADKQVSAQILDFTPAGDVARDASTETTFRETALRAVRLLTPDEIPAFPADANTSKVTVDVDMQRDANTGSGFDVAKAEAKVSGELLKAK